MADHHDTTSQGGFSKNAANSTNSQPPRPGHASGLLPADGTGSSAAAIAAAESQPGAAAAAGPDQLASRFRSHALSLSSRAVHADDYINSHQAVAPPMHVSTTFRYSRDPERLAAWDNQDPNAPFDSHIYSRDTAPNTTRFEAVLSSVLGGSALTYSSGLAAFHAMLVFLNPRRIAIGGGYHGCHGVIRVLNKLNGLEKLELEDEADLAKLQPGDVIHVETPLNPTGEARDLAYYGQKAKEMGCYFTVDATFAPPPLQDPFAYGVDIAMHSGTKYFGGHSDMLCGVLAIHPDRAMGKDGWVRGLLDERLYLGNVMGSMEGWLGVRSLRTLELRVQRQSLNTTELVSWLDGEMGNQGSVVSQLVERVQHASLQKEAKVEGSWLRKQMPAGWGPVFSILMKDENDAKRLPSKLYLFHHATSLGGVESLIEWRAMTDKAVARTLLRISIGVEGWQDLRADLLQGLQALLDEKSSPP